MARQSMPVTSASPIRVGLAPVQFKAGEPSVRPMHMPSLGGWLVAYDRNWWTEDQAAEIVRLMLGSEIEVITAPKEALR